MSNLITISRVEHFNRIANFRLNKFHGSQGAFDLFRSLASHDRPDFRVRSQVDSGPRAYLRPVPLLPHGPRTLRRHGDPGRRQRRGSPQIHRMVRVPKRNRRHRGRTPGQAPPAPGTPREMALRAFPRSAASRVAAVRREIGVRRALCLHRYLYQRQTQQARPR
ncbi:hypothetical protein L596_018780 [Steinernema carpocapsae]|uniref:Uncharacterized protein n=1 Tax=Steinernema carpocapsae TaxID=34508 RepID=A0A4U5N6E1_STECR|nr:hypothetical protein L596_018780 [Steinernema carpocapsae]